jgi:hypothetical protein
MYYISYCNSSTKGCFCKEFSGVLMWKFIDIENAGYQRVFFYEIPIKRAFFILEGRKYSKCESVRRIHGY